MVSVVVIIIVARWLACWLADCLVGHPSKSKSSKHLKHQMHSCVTLQLIIIWRPNEKRRLLRKPCHTYGLFAIFYQVRHTMFAGRPVLTMIMMMESRLALVQHDDHHNDVAVDDGLVGFGQSLVYPGTLMFNFGFRHTIFRL